MAEVNPCALAYSKTFRGGYVGIIRFIRLQGVSSAGEKRRGVRLGSYVSRPFGDFANAICTV